MEFKRVEVKLDTMHWSNDIATQTCSRYGQDVYVTQNDRQT